MFLRMAWGEGGVGGGGGADRVDLNFPHSVPCTSGSLPFVLFLLQKIT